MREGCKLGQKSIESDNMNEQSREAKSDVCWESWRRRVETSVRCETFAMRCIGASPSWLVGVGESQHD